MKTITCSVNLLEKWHKIRWLSKWLPIAFLFSNPMIKQLTAVQKPSHNYKVLKSIIIKTSPLVSHREQRNNWGCNIFNRYYNWFTMSGNNNFNNRSSIFTEKTIKIVFTRWKRSLCLSKRWTVFSTVGKMVVCYPFPS